MNKVLCPNGHEVYAENVRVRGIGPRRWKYTDKTEYELNCPVCMQRWVVTERYVESGGEQNIVGAIPAQLDIDSILTRDYQRLFETEQKRKDDTADTGAGGGE